MLFGFRFHELTIKTGKICRNDDGSCGIPIEKKSNYLVCIFLVVWTLQDNRVFIILVRIDSPDRETGALVNEVRHRFH